MKGYSFSVRYLLMIMIAISAVLVVASVFYNNLGGFETFSKDALEVFIK